LKRRIFLLAISIIMTALPLLSASSGEPAAGRSSIHIRGAETVMSLIQYSAEEYMSGNPNAIISVSGGGTKRGIKSLIDGTSQIAMASSEIDEELLLFAEEKDVTLVKHIVAYDAIVPIVNLNNPVSNLSKEQLRKIYTSKITNWKEVSGKDLPIALTTRNLSSGTYEGWKLLVIGKEAVISPHAIPMESNPLRKYISENPEGIGYCAFSYIDNSIKPLTVNGILASSESIKSGKYPLKRELMLYTRDDASADIINFIEYVKEATPKFAEATGVFPLN
jgi:phosphate transport system substrate-binding protein